MTKSPETMEPGRPITTASFIQYFEEFRKVRDLYKVLEMNRYKAEWSALETSDGGKGDLGQAALNELRLRNRYPMEGALENPNADTTKQREKLEADTAHEVVDLIWSTVRMADLIGLNAEAICREAASEPFTGTPRQALNRYSIAAGAMDELIDPPTKLIFPYDPNMSRRDLANYYLKCEFQATASLVNFYEINLDETVKMSMGQLAKNIPREHISEQA